MDPTAEARDQLFRGFARALFTADLAALYRCVAPDFLWSFHDGLGGVKALRGAEAIGAHLAEQKARFSEQRFHDVAYHHLPACSFMTFGVTEVVRETGERREQRGVERYTFQGGLLATKDVYRKPI